MSHATPSLDPAAPVSIRPATPPPDPAPAATDSGGRLQSLDAYRGLIMVALAFNGFGLAGVARNYLRENPGSGFWAAVLHQFEHVEWIGIGFWDLIQPSFMFMVGVSMAYSYVRRQREGESWGRMFGHACTRAVVLIALAIFLSSGSSRSTNWTLMNVLAQIGLGYPFLFLLWGKSPRFHAITAAVLLAGTWALYAFHSGAGLDLAKGNPQVGVTAAWAQQNLADVGAAWHKNANVGHAIDTWLLNQFPRREAFVFNSGGYQTINFIPSLVTMLFGLMCGELLRSRRTPQSKGLLLLYAGIAGLVLGTVLQWCGVPLVKRIWTPSWALYSTGWCCLILAALYAIMDVRQWRSWAFPLIVVGMNSIAIYCMGQLLRGWTARSLQTHLGEDVFKIFGAAWSPFLQATMVGLVFWLVCYWMYKRKIFLRI